MTDDSDDIRELTEADFASAIKMTVRRRIMSGVVEPGDATALRRFVRLTEDQFAKALGVTVEALRRYDRDGVTEGPVRALFMIAARRPRAIRDALLPPTTQDPKKTALRVGRHRVVCEYQPVELESGEPGISSDELERMELSAAAAVLAEDSAYVAGGEMKFARKALGFTRNELAKVMNVAEADVAQWEASDIAAEPARRSALLTLVSDVSRARATEAPREVRLLSAAEALHEAWQEQRRNDP